MQNTKPDHKLYWSCRRGMLELDLILIPFLQNCYTTLTPEQQQQFTALLTATDPELYAWLTGQSLPDATDLHAIIHLIRHYAQDPSRPRGV